MTAWRKVRLGECCEIVSGATPSTSDADCWDGDICWATPKDLSGLQGHFISDTPRKLTKVGLASCSATILPPNSVLFSSRAPIGHVAINTVPMATNQGFKSFVPGPDVDAKFLFHWLRANRPFLESLGVGATFKEVSKAVVTKVEIPLPSLLEQRRVAAALDKVDELRVKRREALAHLDRLAQSIFLEMFGDPKFNLKAWPLEPIESVVLDMRGGAALEPEDFVAEGFPVLHKGAIKPAGQLETDPKKKAFTVPAYAEGRPQNVVNREYVAVTLRDLVPTGPSIGLAADLQHAAQERYLLAQGAYGVRLDPKKVLPDYFVQLSNMPNFRHVLRQHAVGSTQIHIRNPVYLSIKIPVPSLDLQLRFAHRMRNLRLQAKCAEDSLTAFNDLFRSLQFRAFNGTL